MLESFMCKKHIVPFPHNSLGMDEMETQPLEAPALQSASSFLSQTTLCLDDFHTKTALDEEPQDSKQVLEPESPSKDDVPVKTICRYPLRWIVKATNLIRLMKSSLLYLPNLQNLPSTNAFHQPHKIP